MVSVDGNDIPPTAPFSEQGLAIISPEQESNHWNRTQAVRAVPSLNEEKEWKDPRRRPLLHSFDTGHAWPVEFFFGLVRSSCPLTVQAIAAVTDGPQEKRNPKFSFRRSCLARYSS